MKNIPINKYFDNLDYDFIETYSFKRGHKLEAQLKTTNNFNVDSSSFLISAVGQFDITSEIISVIEKGTEEYNILNKVINKQIGEVPSWMCAPFYRDALVFRTNKNEIVDTLNICFGCSYMQNTSGFYIDADQKMYEDLTSMLKSLGHNIQPNENEIFKELVRGIKKGR